MLVKEVLSLNKENILCGESHQAKLYWFKINEKKYVLKVYFQLENNEGCILEKCQVHPNVVRIYEHGFIDGYEYIVMEFLEKCLKPNKSLSKEHEEQLLSLMRFFRNNGIIHRELNPRHLFVDNRGLLKLIDFGFASSPEHPLKHFIPNGLNEDYGFDDELAVKKIIDLMGEKKA